MNAHIPCTTLLADWEIDGSSLLHCAGCLSVSPQAPEESCALARPRSDDALVLSSVSGLYYVPGTGSRAGEVKGKHWQKDQVAEVQRPGGRFQKESSAASTTHAGCHLNSG